MRFTKSLILLVALSFCSGALFAENSTLNLRDRDWSKGNIHIIDTEWDFFWEKLLTPETIVKETPTSTFPVPGAWNESYDDKPIFSGKGYATYRLKILTPDNLSTLYLYVPDMASAYQLWSNGNLVAHNGKTGKIKTEEVPAYLPQVASLTPINGEIELILATSNFHYKWGGVWYPLKLTDQYGLYDLREKPIILSVLSSSILLAAAIVSFFIYFSRKKETVILFFGLLCVTTGVRRLLIDERVFYLFNWWNWHTLQMMENLMTFLSFPLFMSYYGLRFPLRSSNKSIKISWALTAPFVFLGLTTDVSFYTKLYPLYQLIMLLAVIYVVVTYLKLLTDKRKGIALFGIGILISTSTIVNDILAYNYIIDTPNIAHIGILVFVVLQALDLLRSYLYNFEKIEKMSEALQERNNELMRLDAFKDDFLATTSHELRTPLHGISGLAEHLQAHTNDKLTTDQQHQLSLITSTTKRLGSLVNDILDFSGIKHGNLDLHLKQTDFRAIANSVITTLSPLLDGRDIKLSANIDNDIVEVYADENRLQQILFNLLGNAIKFTEEGFIQLNAKKVGNKAVIEIIDTGVGISPEKSDLLFQPFQRLGPPANGDQTGSGLGLSISKQLVAMHGGDLKVISREGYGTTLRFELNLSEKSHPTSANDSASFFQKQSVSPQSVAPQPVSKSSENFGQTELNALNIEFDDTITTSIFAVDDEEVNRSLIQAQLSGTHCHLETFPSGATLLERLKQKTPDLILLDYMMPNMSGLEVCKTIRKQYDNYELPIIMVTARYQVKDVVECLSAGANDYLVKPYHEKELLARVFNQISTRQYWLTDQENSQLKQEILKRKSLEKQLANANKRLLQALDLSDEGIAIFDESMTVIYSNDALEKNWAKTNEHDLIGRSVKALIPEDQQEYFDVAIKNGPMPLTLSIKLSDADTFYQLHIDRFSVDKTTYYRLLAPKNTGDGTAPTPSSEVIKELTTELTESRQKFDQLEAALKQVTRLVKNNQPPDTGAVAETTTTQSPDTTDKRDILVKLLRTALIFWERYSGKSKIDLAEESQCWRVYLDGTTAKTRTLDRYLSTKTLPEKPRWRLAIRTANFVIDKCALSGEDFEEITKLMDDLDKAYS